MTNRWDILKTVLLVTRNRLQRKPENKIKKTKTKHQMPPVHFSTTILSWKIFYIFFFTQWKEWNVGLFMKIDQRRRTCCVSPAFSVVLPAFQLTQSRVAYFVYPFLKQTILEFLISYAFKWSRQGTLSTVVHTLNDNNVVKTTSP